MMGKITNGAFIKTRFLREKGFFKEKGFFLNGILLDGVDIREFVDLLFSSMRHIHGIAPSTIHP